MLKRLTPLFVLFASLAGCVSGGTLEIPNARNESVRANLREAWSEFFDKEERLNDIHYRIASINSPLCPNLWFSSGINYIDREHYRKAERYRVFKYPLPPDAGDEWSVVQQVAKSGPAWEAGIRPGDVYRLAYDNPNTGLYRIERRTPSGELETIEVQMVRICRSFVHLKKDASINAFTDGTVVAINEGLIDAVDSTDEIAFVVAHEVAHVALQHIEKRKSNATKRGLLGGLLDIGAALAGGCRYGGCNAASSMAASGAAAFAKEFEAEADYMAAYFAARAGYDPHAGSTFFARAMNSTSTPSVYGTTHPVDAARELNIGLYVEEILAKRAAGKQLIPNKRSN